MTQSMILRDLLGTLKHRGSQLWRRPDTRSIGALCTDLLSEVGDVSALRIGGQVIATYATLSRDDRYAFFCYLAHDLDVDPAEVSNLAQSYGAAPSVNGLAALSRAAEPRRQELFRRLNRLSGATRTLVAMRHDLFEAMRLDPDLARIDLDFAHLFASWFNPGFLDLRQISWRTPANVLEKIIAYEAVHSIDSWDDLRRRLEPEDRRCFAYFHPSLPDEPLIFVEVALCSGIAGSIQTLLAAEREVLPTERADTAVFYSISNCQAGLRGVSFGNSLIKRVVEQLKAEFSNLKTFVTLSPIPGLRAWADAEGVPLDRSDNQRALAARYLIKAKRPDGLPLDSVARFHLGNGARVHDVHADADVSEKGRRESGGTMVNYLYDPAAIDSRIEAYFKRSDVAVSTPLERLLNPPRARRRS